MKKFISLVALVILLFTGVNSYSQVTIPAANTNTNGDRHPLSAFFGFERTALIYTQAEIGQFGNIVKIGFFLNSTSVTTPVPVVVKMNTTTATSLLASQTYATTSAGATTVYSGTVTSSQYVAGTWVEITLDVPFNYSSDNLLVLVETNFGGGGSGEGSTSRLFRRSAPVPAANRMTVWNADNAPPTTTATPTSTRSNVQLTFGASVQNDMGVSAISSTLNPLAIVIPGTPIEFVSTARNYGTDPQSLVPVYYSVNGGSPVGPVTATGPINQGGTENVTFNGGNTFTPLAAGVYTIKSWTALPGDENPANDTFTVNLTVQSVRTLPFVETWNGLGLGWTVVTENPVGGTALWSLGIATNHNGTTDTLIAANFFNAATGRREVLRSPVIDVTSATNPVLNFYVAYKTYINGAPPINPDDSLEVVISTDNGVSFFTPTTVYNKSFSSTPSLATRPPSTTSFFPDSSVQYRHETVYLNNAIGGKVVVGFRGKSQFGNRLWISDVIVSDANTICDQVISSPTTATCGMFTTSFSTVGMPPKNNNLFIENGSLKSTGKTESMMGNLDIVAGDNIMINSSNLTDNPAGGTVYTAVYMNTDPGQLVAPNATATAPNGSVFDPGFVYHDFWANITYSGNDYLGSATYDLHVDISSVFFSDPDALYIVKRTDRTGAWICQNTTRSGNILTVTGLTRFSDFAIAGNDALPVELASFVSTINGRNVTLNWSTASELNNAGFDVERKSVTGEWTKIANVAGNGTSNDAHNYSFTDRNVESGKYNYRLKQVDFNGNFTYYNLSNEVNIGIPASFDLSQNYPNPFNPSTTINYDLPFDSKVSIKLFDMSGREVASLVNETKVAGYYSVNFNASTLSSGVYFYRISADGNGQNFVATKKMMLVK